MSPQPLINGESMSVPEQKPIVVYRANGTSTDFPITFDLHDETQLHVSVNYIVLDVSEYNLNDRNVVFNTPPNDGDEVILSRLTARERETNYQSFNNSFRPQALNWDFNKIWHVLQEQNILDAEILARINQQIEWHRTHNFNFDYLASVREQRVAEGLKGYSDTLAAALMQGSLGNVFGGVTAGVVFADDNRSVQTWLGELTPLEYTEKALYALNNGAFKAYPTLQAANADIENIPLNVKVEVLSAADGGSYYKENEDSVTLTKSQYDARKVAVSEAQNYTNQKITEMLSTREELDDEFGENDTTPIIPPTSPHLTLNIRTVGSNVTASGTTEANAAIKVTVGNNVVNTTASASGAWSVDLVVMSEGPHTAVVTATDRAGNTTAQSINFIVNITTGISVTITGVTTLNNNEFVISGTGEVGSVVDVDVDSQSLSVLVGQDGVWSTVVSGLVAASYTAIATHTNSTGITTTATFDFNVDVDVDVDVDATRGLFDVSKIADGYTISPSTALISKVADTNNKIALIPITVGDVYIYSEHTMSLPSNFAAQVFDDIALLGQQSPTGRIIPSAVQTGHANWYKLTLSDPSIAALSITLQIASNNDFNLANSLRVFKDSLPVDAVPSLSINSIPAISAATPFVLSGTSKMLDYEVVIIVKDDTNTTKVSARTTVGESGNWSYSVAGLVSGTYTIDLSINIGSGKALIRKNLVVE